MKKINYKKMLIIILVVLIFTILIILNHYFKWFSVGKDYFKIFGTIAIVKPGVTEVNRETIASRPAGSFYVPDNELVKIKTLVIPSSVKSINLTNSGYLKNIYVSIFNHDYSSKNGILYNKDKTILIRYPERKGGEYVIPETVTIIDPSAFWDCQNIKKVTITKNINQLPPMLFYMNYNLEEVIIDGKIKTIPYSLFHGCKKLTSFELPDSVEILEANCLEYSPNKTTFKVGRNIKDIDDDAFDSLEYIENIEVDENNLNYSSDNGIIYNKDKTVLIRCPIAKKGKIIIPDNVKTIKEGAFSWCNNIAYVEISNNVEKIEDNTFRGCSNLKEVKLGTNVKNIGEYAFSYCEKLKKVQLNDSLQTIDKCASYETSESLKEIEIPSNVSQIGEECFDSLNNSLVIIKFKKREIQYPTNNNWGNVSIIYE